MGLRRFQIRIPKVRGVPFSVVTSLVSLAISMYVGYETVFKPFSPRVPLVSQVHYQPLVFPNTVTGSDSHFAVDVDVLFENPSPNSGVISELGVVIWPKGSPHVYVLDFFQMRQRDPLSVEVHTSPSIEDYPPFVLGARSWERKTVKFWFASADTFPLETGEWNLDLVFSEPGKPGIAIGATTQFFVSESDLKEYHEFKRNRRKMTIRAPMRGTPLQLIASQRISQERYRAIARRR